jgi:hypothetical protein
VKFIREGGKGYLLDAVTNAKQEISLGLERRKTACVGRYLLLDAQPTRIEQGNPAVGRACTECVRIPKMGYGETAIGLAEGIR